VPKYINFSYSFYTPPPPPSNPQPGAPLPTIQTFNISEHPPRVSHILGMHVLCVNAPRLWCAQMPARSASYSAAF